MNEKYSQNKEQPPPPPYPEETQFSQYPQQQAQNHQQPILINVPALHIANNGNCKLNKSKI
jgi:hypothetical protein